MGYQFKERGKLAVNLKKISINLQQLFTKPLTLFSLKKIFLISTPSHFLYLLKDRGWLNDCGRLIDSFRMYGVYCTGVNEHCVVPNAQWCT